MTKMQRVTHVAFIGPSGAGKTTLLDGLLRRLRQRGLDVGFVKYTHHPVELDTPGKDSWRIREAGADPVLLVTPERYLLQLSRQSDGIESAFAGCDLVLHEGDAQSMLPKVLVGITAASGREFRGQVIACVEGDALPGVPSFRRDDVDGVADLLAAYAREVNEGLCPSTPE